MYTSQLSQKIYELKPDEFLVLFLTDGRQYVYSPLLGESSMGLLPVIRARTQTADVCVERIRADNLVALIYRVVIEPERHIGDYGFTTPPWKSR